MSIAPAQLRDELDLVRRVPSGETSDYGDVVYADDTAETIRCVVEAVDALEEGTEGETRINLYRASVSPEVDLTGIDRVVWNGLELEVVGEPQRFAIRGRPHHSRLDLRQIEG